MKNDMKLIIAYIGVLLSLLCMFLLMIGRPNTTRVAIQKPGAHIAQCYEWPGYEIKSITIGENSVHVDMRPISENKAKK